jgi:hypothetical protein
MKFSDYVGQTINARYAVERNVDGADVPVTREGEVTPRIDSEGSLFLESEFDDDVYPFDDNFEFVKP